MKKRYPDSPPDTVYTGLNEKPVEWIGSSKDDLVGLPGSVQQDTGYQLHRVQQGKLPRNFSPMPRIGSGVSEIRVNEDSDTYRTFFVAKFPEAVYVLHSFKKKSTKGAATPKRDLDLGKQRYKEMLKQRSEEGFD